MQVPAGLRIDILSSMQEPQGLWIRKPQNDTATVFVHGILSSGETAWRNGDVYWPQLLASEDSLSATGIYVFSYRTNAFSGNYSIGDAVEALNAYLNLDQLLGLKKLIFVCHSMGGIVARQFVVTRQATLIEKAIRVGMFLVASPSLGSSYATLFSAIANVLGNSQAEALRFSDNNTWLNDLDRNFMNLKESGRLDIEGQEVVEDKFVALSWLMRKQVVQAFAGNRYFGESIKIPDSDHFSIAKPSSSLSLQHRMLVQFIDSFLKRKTPVDAGRISAAGLLRLRELEPVEIKEWREFDSRRVTVGRAPQNDFVIDSPQVSWEHGVFAQELGVMVYRHLSRTNPTLIHGRGRDARLEEGGIQEMALVNQDRIKIGPTTLVVEFTLGSDEGYIGTAKAVEA